jgi:phosphohistidine phosphatase
MRDPGGENDLVFFLVLCVTGRVGRKENSMKTLHMLRHAKSDWGKPGLADHDRPLNARGLRDAPRMGAALQRQLAPMGIHVSTARRAQMTLQGLCAGWPGLAAAPHCSERDLYTFSAMDLLAWLRARSDSEEQLFLIGHNPGLTDLANLLVPELRLANLPTAGYLRIQLSVQHWASVSDGAGILQQQLFPRDLPPEG